MTSTRSNASGWTATCGMPPARRSEGLANEAGNFEVDFHGTIKTFMPEAAQFMFAERMRKFGKPR